MFRRSSVVLKSLGSSHTDLQLLINQLKDTRSLCKAFASSQSATNQDFVKWSEQEDNRAIKETVARVGELLLFYTEIQKTFAEHLKDFRNQFEMILEGERIVDGAKSQLEIAQEKESKSRKEVKRASKRKDGSELRELSEKLTQAEREKDLAHVELTERLREHEAVKMIRLKNGLVKWSNAHKEMAAKSHLLFSAAHDIAQLIPDVPNTSEIQTIRYSGGPAALRITMETKEKLQQPSDQIVQSQSLQYPDELPPPYAEIQPAVNPYLYSSPEGAVGAPPSGHLYSSSLNSSYASYPNSANVSSMENSFHNSSLHVNLNSSFGYDPNAGIPEEEVQLRRRSDQQNRQSGSDLGLRMTELSLSNVN